MSFAGQLLLLAALVASGYSAFAALFRGRRDSPTVVFTGRLAGFAAAAALTAVSGILAWALAARDFEFAYVAQYTSRALSWQYALSAFWVGQAGSLLLWAWMLAILAVVYRFWPRGGCHDLRRPAFGLLMAYVCFLTAVMVFAADPMRPGTSPQLEGDGLSPLLQHPAMLWHPPIVFLGYSGWAIPCALSVMAMFRRRIDASWIEEARPWMLFSWLVLGIGILLGAQWAYEELGWGGYWAWDPVENGSLIPWLTGTVLIHAAMVWQIRGGLKKTTCALAIATFGLCNFATFLTRSGIFSSLHAFSQSPVGWMFLILMAVLAAVGAALLLLRWRDLAADRSLPSLWCRETAAILAAIAMLLLAATALVGTSLAPLSGSLLGRRIVLGPEFYNSVLIPTGLVLLLVIVPVPLLRWGKPPTAAQTRWLILAACVGAIAAIVAGSIGVRSPVVLAVWGLSGVALASLCGAIALDTKKGNGRQNEPATRSAVLPVRRREYAGFLIHLGFVSLVIGITGSSLGSRHRDVVMTPGDVLHWAGYTIHYSGIVQRDLSEIHVVEARLEVSRDGRPSATLLPAQHLHSRQNQWTTEVALSSTWLDDFYAIFYYGEEDGKARLTFIRNPMMRWLWASGWIAALGTLLRLWPSRRRRTPASPDKRRDIAARPRFRRPLRSTAEAARSAE